MDEKPKCGECGADMVRKCFMGGFPPVWLCKACEYRRIDERKEPFSTPDPKAPEGAIAIPEDLRKQYDLHKKWLAIPWHERPRGTASVEAILRENAVNDIERIAALTQRAELAESRVKTMDWQRITPENLPKVGDELYSGRSQLVMRLLQKYAPMIPMMEDFTFAGWTHFRPISAPAPDSAPVGGKEGER